MPKILVIGEVAAGHLQGVTAELLGAATRLSAGGGVACALVGVGVSGAAQAAIAQGADTVYLVEHPALAAYQSGTFVPVVAELVQQSGAGVVLLGQTSLGRDLAPRLATRLGSAAAMDALHLELDGHRVKVTRSCYGGNARQVVKVQTDPQVITVRAKSQDPLAPDTGRSGKVETVAVTPPAPRTTFLGKQQAESAGVRLEDAQIVISGGRGLGGAENFAALESIARVLGAAVGASRAACDLGWYPPSQQVGLTGTVVSPTLYIAVAISGASQHMAGCGGSKNIIAINKDPEASIFRFCKFGIVDDYKKILPPLEAELKKAVAAG